MANQMRAINANMIEDRDDISRPLLHRIGRGRLTATDAAVIEADGAKKRRKRLDLGLPEAGQTTKARNEHHRFAEASAVVMQAGAGNLKARHGVARCRAQA